MDIRLSKIFRELLVKIPQSASKWMSILKKVREWLVKMAQNAPKWISVFQKFHGSYLSKYLKVHENGCQFKKNPGVACENGSKCTKMDIRFSKISRG